MFREDLDWMNGVFSPASDDEDTQQYSIEFESSPPGLEIFDVVKAVNYGELIPPDRLIQILGALGLSNSTNPDKPSLDLLTDGNEIINLNKLWQLKTAGQLAIDVQIIYLIDRNGPRTFAADILKYRKESDSDTV